MTQTSNDQPIIQICNRSFELFATSGSTSEIIVGNFYYISLTLYGQNN